MPFIKNIVRKSGHRCNFTYTLVWSSIIPAVRINVSDQKRKKTLYRDQQLLISLVLSPFVVKIKLPLPLLKTVSLIKNKSVSIKEFLLAISCSVELLGICQFFDVVKCYALPGITVWVTGTFQWPVTRSLLTVDTSYSNVKPNTYITLLKESYRAWQFKTIFSLQQRKQNGSENQSVKETNGGHFCQRNTQNHSGNPRHSNTLLHISSQLVLE